MEVNLNTSERVLEAVKKAKRVLPLVASGVVLMALAPLLTNVAFASPPSIPSSVLVAVAYADTEGRGSQAGQCGVGCFPSPWCGSPGVQFVGSSTNYDGNSTDQKNCQGGDWDTGAIMVANTGQSPITFTNLTVTFPLPSSGVSVVPACKAEMRPITFNVWFGQQYYWHNPVDPAFYQGPLTVPPGGEAIFAGTSSANSYQCPTGNYPSTGPVNGTYDFDTSDAYYMSGCSPTTDPSSAPRITFSADGFVPTTYNDTGHTIDTGGIDTGNCQPTAVDPQWGHEDLGWRAIGTCGESCPQNNPAFSALTSSTGSSSSKSNAASNGQAASSGALAATTSSSSGSAGSVVEYSAAAVAVVVIIALGYVAVRRGRNPS